MYYVYILWSEKTQKFYCGYTSDLEDRIMRHNYVSSLVVFVNEWEIYEAVKKEQQPEDPEPV